MESIAQQHANEVSRFREVARQAQEARKCHEDTMRLRSIVEEESKKMAAENFEEREAEEFEHHRYALCAANAAKACAAATTCSRLVLEEESKVTKHAQDTIRL